VNGYDVALTVQYLGSAWWASREENRRIKAVKVSWNLCDSGSSIIHSIYLKCGKYAEAFEISLIAIVQALTLRFYFAEIYRTIYLVSFWNGLLDKRVDPEDICAIF